MHDSPKDTWPYMHRLIVFLALILVVGVGVVACLQLDSFITIGKPGDPTAKLSESNFVTVYFDTDITSVNGHIIMVGPGKKFGPTWLKKPPVPFVITASSSQRFVGSHWQAICLNLDWRDAKDILVIGKVSKKASIKASIAIPKFKLERKIWVEGYLYGRATYPVVHSQHKERFLPKIREKYRTKLARLWVVP
jgi:hypothetical protein